MAGDETGCATAGDDETIAIKAMAQFNPADSLIRKNMLIHID
jgi:hypothetical protein